MVFKFRKQKDQDCSCKIQYLLYDLEEICKAFSEEFYRFIIPSFRRSFPSLIEWLFHILHSLSLIYQFVFCVGLHLERTEHLLPKYMLRLSILFFTEKALGFSYWGSSHRVLLFHHFSFLITVLLLKRFCSSQSS